eukprot:gene10207-biopygen222
MRAASAKESLPLKLPQKTTSFREAWGRGCMTNGGSRREAALRESRPPKLRKWTDHGPLAKNVLMSVCLPSFGTGALGSQDTYARAWQGLPAATTMRVATTALFRKVWIGTGRLHCILPSCTTDGTLRYAASTSRGEEHPVRDVEELGAKKQTRAGRGPDAGGTMKFEGRTREELLRCRSTRRSRGTS